MRAGSERVIVEHVNSTPANLFALSTAIVEYFNVVNDIKTFQIYDVAPKRYPIRTNLLISHIIIK